MDNRPLALVIWTINVALLAVLGFVVYTFLVQPQSPGRPAYIPVEEDLPRLSEPNDWRRIDVNELVRMYSEVDRRPFNRPPYEQLSAFEYHRFHPPEPPRKIPQPEPVEPRPDPPAPTAEEALADLMEKVQIVMLSVPHRAIVLLPQRNERVTIEPPGVGNESARIVRTSLREFGIPADVLEIVSDDDDIGGVLMQYTYRDEEFTLLLPRPHSVPMDLLPAARNRPDLPGAVGARPDRAGERASGDDDETGEDEASDGSNGPATAHDDLQGIPDPDFPDTLMVGENDWVIGWDEAGHVNENFDELVDELRPRQYTDPETGERHVQITNVPSDSHAARRGFRSGDILISINEVGVSSRDEAIDYVRNNLEEPEYRVVIIRQGREQRLTYRNPRYRSD